ncbi:MAG: hypothetical protein CTY34_00795 [Methylobacter sp.]|nr:MAG: hypothetical protein CTY34_00795 [Methylobacter sp.]PPD19494.1 MAG: hypothetical protein CTY24_10745 [Methylobacter sp.]PPD35323.1 MAG: hypothetical protein CTY18_06600 [Methylomonas sp.]
MSTPTRILFVDDEQNVLDGIRRMLRRQQGQWELFFAHDGESAIQLLNRQTIDVLVTDMKMPGIQGDELLQYTAKHFPETARLVLTGQTEQSGHYAILEYAHQCLAKPCEAETLKKAVSEALQSRNLINNPRIRAALGDIGSLPSLPRIYQELEAAIQKHNVNSSEIATIFASDMAMSAKVLQLVNSSFFGLGRRVSSVNDAVMLLGIERVRGLVLCSTVFEALKSNTACPSLSIESLWQNAFTTAKLARAICLSEKQKDDRPDQAYISGLMHSLGLLLFSTRMPAKMQIVIDQATTGGNFVYELERQVFQASHAEAAAYLLSLWKLPPRIIEAVLLQHKPGLIGYDGFCAASAVHIAIALLAEDKAPSDKVLAHELDFDYLNRLRLTERISAWRALAHDLKAETQPGE